MFVENSVVCYSELFNLPVTKQLQALTLNDI